MPKKTVLFLFCKSFQKRMFHAVRLILGKGVKLYVVNPLKNIGVQLLLVL